MSKPAVLVCRAVFPDIVDRLREHFDVEDNPSDVVWTPAELIQRLQGKAGVFITGTQPIDTALLDACPQLKAVCSMEQAKGKEKVALAEAEYNYTGKQADANKIATEKADAHYAVAKEMCDEKGGNAKDVCVAEAKAEHKKALADAKLNKKVGEARNDAVEDKREADYKVATEKCDSLAGDAKSACISAAKSKYGKT